MPVLYNTLPKCLSKKIKYIDRYYHHKTSKKNQVKK